MAARILSSRGYIVSPLALESRPDWVARALTMAEAERKYKQTTK